MSAFLVIIAGKILGYNAGQATGITVVVLTQSAVIGVGQGAIASLKVPPADIKLMSDFVPIGYAVTYILGTIGSAFFSFNNCTQVIRYKPSRRM
ncbi:aspartate-alanine antiporter-like transporter [Cellulosilyticum lentocellum]|uniref:aspartate-alanine antiporter-like transporter n=1 Tax=Cellulosilyticum lentocellum TaxID=29360 RepID=UPI000A002F88